MPRKHSLVELKEFSEISYTPLIDLTMLLLVTFIITYPLMEQGVHVNLPHGKADELQAEQSRTITLDIKGNLYLDNELTTLSQLNDEMSALGMSRPDIAVFVRADKDLKYGRLIDVMTVLHGAQITRIALVTQSE